MKKAIIFHGTDCKPEDFWYTWVAEKLRVRGYAVQIPYYPTINHEKIETFLPKVLKAHSFDKNTVLIGHSAGGPLLLSILENIDAPIGQAILVAGYSQQLPGEEKDPVLQTSYNWDKIKENIDDPIFINSVDDPWGCDAKQGRIMFDHLGGTQIIRNDGHFGSETYKQAYKEFPLLLSLILKESL